MRVQTCVIYATQRTNQQSRNERKKKISTRANLSMTVKSLVNDFQQQQECFAFIRQWFVSFSHPFDAKRKKKKKIITLSVHFFILPWHSPIWFDRFVRSEIPGSFGLLLVSLNRLWLYFFPPFYLLHKQVMCGIFMDWSARLARKFQIGTVVITCIQIWMLSIVCNAEINHNYMNALAHTTEKWPCWIGLMKTFYKIFIPLIGMNQPTNHACIAIGFFFLFCGLRIIIQNYRNN